SDRTHCNTRRGFRQSPFATMLSYPHMRRVEDLPSRRSRCVMFALCAALAAGCATKGAMTGEISVPEGPKERVSLQYVGDRTGDSGYLSVTLPGGESCNGPYARVGSAGALAPGLDINSSVVEWGENADEWTFGETDSDKMVALLQGSRGNKIRCRFTL